MNTEQNAGISLQFLLLFIRYGNIWMYFFQQNDEQGEDYSGSEDGFRPGHAVCYDAWSLSILYNFGNFAGRNLITKL